MIMSTAVMIMYITNEENSSDDSGVCILIAMKNHVHWNPNRQIPSDFDAKNKPFILIFNMTDWFWIVIKRMIAAWFDSCSRCLLFNQENSIDTIPKRFEDPEIYVRAKAKADKVHSKPSAYKSMFIMEEYLRMGGRVKSSKNGLRKWLNEEWKNLTPYSMGLVTLDKSPACGQKHPDQGVKPSVCRPKDQAKNYTKKQVQEAVRIKETGSVIQWSKLKK